MSRSLQNINLKIFCVACRHNHAENLPTKLVQMLTLLCREPLSSWVWENRKGLAAFTALFLCCCSGSWWVSICCVTNFLCFFRLEIEFILVYFYLFTPHKVLSWSILEASLLMLSLWNFCLLIALLLLIMLIDSRTWCARIGVFELTKIVVQWNSFQKGNLNFTVQNIG